jgi:L-seryl-tRNA(Ser) seleniumtransferase
LILAPGRAGASALEGRLRTGKPPVLVRVQDERVLVDLRTVAPEEEAGLLAALTAALTATRTGEDA